MIITGGTGKQNAAEVNDDFQLVVKAIMETEAQFISGEKGEAFSWASDTYSAAQDDTILLVKNTATDKELHIEAIWVSANADTRVLVHLPTANVTVAGTTITGVNLNTGSSNVAEAEAARDETGNSLGDLIWSGEIQAIDLPYKLPLQGVLILKKNKSVGVDFTVAATACDVTIMGYYD